MKRVTRLIPFLLLLASCARIPETAVELDCEPTVYPDYVGVTVPPNMAPLNFRVEGEGIRRIATVFEAGGESFRVLSRSGKVRIPLKAWRRLSARATGDSIEVRVLCDDGSGWKAYSPFKIHISEDRIDPYLAYRLIEPGYETWNHMGIYQRCLENFKEKAIIRNSMTGGNCMNCHSFCLRDPDRMLFHMRAVNPGTILIRDGEMEKLNTKTDKTISALVYPYWHPDGRYVAFSVNDTKQAFHTHDRNRIEVFDLKSDVVIYDTEERRVIVSPVLSSPGSFETFPTFSQDGETLYFCSADSLEMPAKYNELKYSLCSVSFNKADGTVGNQVDTLYSEKSVSFPRVSPDGRHLMMTVADYGTFSIWHQDADLAMIDLDDRSIRKLDEANSLRTESYHSWSGNSSWAVFSSRRGDGLYTRPYFVHIDRNGNASKPFLLPQKDPDFYDGFMKSYNIPEMTSGPVRVPARKIARLAKKGKGMDVSS